MKEIWRDIKGFEGKYQVSNLGNVKSLNYNYTGKEKLLKLRIGKDGRLRVDLGSSKKGYSVHRLVAEAFLDKRDFKYFDEEDRLKHINNLDKIEVNHKDKEPKNNCVDNLEWCTHLYNLFYSVVRAPKKVYQYDFNGNLIREWESASEIERQLGYSQGHITNCCNGKRKTYKCFIWSYETLTKEQVREKLENRYSARSKKVYQYDLEGNFIREWVSAHEIERQLGYSQANIWKCCLGKIKSAYGYIWKYAD